MAHPTQKFLQELRDNPDPALASFVQHDVEPGREYTTNALWHYYNGHLGYYNDPSTFRYALRLAGMRVLDNGKLVRDTP